jgi:low affinity Fe/Cu permease
MKTNSKKPEPPKVNAASAQQGNPLPNPLDGVVSVSEQGSILGMQTGLFHLGQNRALQSGTTEPLQEDIRSLKDHARAMARETYRDRYDPSANVHDAMHQREYERALAERGEAEKGEKHAAANLRDADTNLAGTPKAGNRPAASPILVAAFIVAITLTVAPTLHDDLFITIGDDLLAWFFSSLCAAFVGTMLTLAILTGRRTVWTWVGVGAGVILGIGLGAVRLAGAEGAGQVIIGLGLTVVEIAAVLLLEWVASGLRANEETWLVRHAAESQAIANRDAAQVDLTRWQARIKEFGDEIANKIAFVEDRHNRNIHIGELEAVAIKAVLDGYNAGNAENVGRIRAVSRRTA